MEPDYPRYLPGTLVTHKSNGRTCEVISDQGFGADRTLSVRTAAGARLVVNALNFRKASSTEQRKYQSEIAQVQTANPAVSPPKAMSSETLFQYKNAAGVVAMGTYLATNRDGDTVLKLVGTNEVVVVPTKEVSEVRPYTFSAVDPDGRTYEFAYKPDLLKKGDRLILKDSDTFLRVTKVDTGSTTRTVFKGTRLLTEEVGAPAAEEDKDA